MPNDTATNDSTITTFRDGNMWTATTSESPTGRVWRELYTPRPAPRPAFRGFDAVGREPDMWIEDEYDSDDCEPCEPEEYDDEPAEDWGGDYDNYDFGRGVNPDTYEYKASYLQLVREIFNIDRNAAMYMLKYAPMLQYFHQGDNVDVSFNWASTPQGHDYWADIHDQWLDNCHAPYAFLDPPY